MTFLRDETEREGERDSLSQQAIGERLRIDRTTMVSLIDDLERAGYVKRDRNPGDRRAYVITLTPAGKRAQARAEQAVDADALEFFGRLSESERQQLHRLLDTSHRAARVTSLAAAGSCEPRRVPVRHTMATTPATPLPSADMVPAGAKDLQNRPFSPMRGSERGTAHRPAVVCA